MEPQIIGLLGIVLLLILVLAGMRIAYASFLVAFLGLLVLKNWNIAFEFVGRTAYTQNASWSYVVIPMFVLMGLFLSNAGLADEIFVAAQKWFGHLPGGLALACIWGSAGFAACTGSTAAADAVAGKLLIRKMIGLGYKPSMATGVVASAGCLAILIPPSATIVIYGIITQQSIGALLIGGVLPGLLSATVYAAGTYFIAIRNPAIMPALPRVSWRERFASLKGTSIAFMILGLMLGGLYFGIFTPSEAGAAGAAAIFLFCLVRRRVTFKMVKDSLRETARINAMIFVLMIGILGLMNFMSISGTTGVIVNYIAGLVVNRWLIFAAIIVLYIILGMFLGSYAMMYLTLPVLFPLVVSLEFNPVWFGIIVIIMCELGSITPPIGYSVFVVNSVIPEVPVQEIFKGCFPFMVMDLIIVGILAAFPAIVTILPTLMKMS